jgi:pyruvate/2-oxoglutarate dehydrogenase complex dihydrolipoamide acyltransferase (E2) component
MSRSRSMMAGRCALLPLALLLAQLGWGAQPAAAQPAAQPAPSGAASGSPAAASGSPAAAAAAGVAAAKPPSGSGAAQQASAPAPAQPGKQPDPVKAACRGETPPPSNPVQGRLQGMIAAPGEEELRGVRLVLEDKASSNHYIVDHFEACEPGGGRFAYSIEVPPGSYDLTLSGKDHETETASGVGIEANQVKRRGFLLVKEETKTHKTVLWLPLVFLLSILLIRWNNIATPSRLGVVAQIRDLVSRLPEGQTRQDLLAAQGELLKKWAVLDWLFWSRGQEIACWSVIHKAELALLEEAPPDKVNVRLGSAEQRLSEIDKTAAKSLAARIDAELKSDPAKINDKARRQLLLEATSYIYYVDGNEFAALNGWQSKSFWLTLVGVALIAAVGIAEGHISLFLAGAVGGFLSRLTRALKRADVPTDYGASWSTLFLSPVAGAISGWFGVALIMLLTDPTVGVLGGPLKVINWDSGNIAATLAAAFVLGFSERLFDRIVSQLEESIDQKKEGAQKTAPKAAQPPPSAQAGGAAAAKPGVASVSPNPAAPGAQVTAQLENLDAAKVAGVVLATDAGDAATLKPQAEGDQLKFTIAAATAPGTYRIVLLTPDLAPPRTDTDQELTVAPA